MPNPTRGSVVNREFLYELKDALKRFEDQRASLDREEVGQSDAIEAVSIKKMLRAIVANVRPPRSSVLFTAEEVEALRSDFETAYREIGEELIDGAHYGDNEEERAKAERLQDKLGRILGIRPL